MKISAMVQGNRWLVRGLNCLGLLVCLLGFWTSIRGNFAGRSLYVDEASVVYSIQTRTLSEMTTEPLPFNQTAPVLWLWLVKVATLLFGSSEVALRSLSVVSYGLALALTAGGGKRFFGVRCPWMAASFLANTRAFLCYSNVVKPYEFEAVCVLGVLIAYGYWCEGKLPWWGTGIAWLVAMAGGNPSLFFVGACLLFEGTGALRHRNGRRFMEVGVLGVAVLGIFAAYYAWWLRGVAGSDFMQDWWKRQMLSIWPLTWTTLVADIHILMRYFFVPTFGVRAPVMAGLVVGAMAMAWAGPNRLRRLVTLGLALALVASTLRLFPIDMRIWVFSFPLFAILVIGFLADFLHGRAAWPMAVLTLGLVLAQLGIPHYWQRDDIYWNGEELNPVLDYVRDHLQDDESVYVTDRALPGVKYHFGYDFERFGNGRDNVIWGNDTWKKAPDLNADAERIEEAGKCWLVLIPVVRSKTDGLWYRLSRSGSITQRYAFQGTPLYYYERTAGACSANDEANNPVNIP